MVSLRAEKYLAKEVATANVREVVDLEASAQERKIVERGAAGDRGGCLRRSFQACLSGGEAIKVTLQ